MAKKYRIEHLNIETTRKCNYSCAHCLRGEAQDVTITPQIIDTMFAQLYQVDEISIIGGEPLLELDAIAYLIDAINRYNLNTKTLSFVTNGSIRNKRIIEILTRYVNNEKDREASIIISDDIFHDKEESEKSYNYYTALNYDHDKICINKYSDRMKKENRSFNILKYSGRAKKYIDDNYNALHNSGIYVRHSDNAFRNHRISIKDEIINCMLVLLANGNVGLLTETDYLQTDKLAIGNIMQDTLQTIVERNNKECPYLCDECCNEISLKSSGLRRTLSIDVIKQNLGCSVANERIKHTWHVRLLAQKEFPKLPVEEIIIATPVPSWDEWVKLLEQLVTYDDTIQAAKDRTLLKVKKDYPLAPDADLEYIAWAKNILLLLNNKNREKFPIIPFGSDDEIIDSGLFYELRLLEQDYIAGRKKTPPEIDPCMLIPNSVNRNEKTEG